MSQRSGIPTNTRTSRELEEGSDAFVRATTGFWSYGHFLSHAAFLCNADFSVLDRLRLPHGQGKKGGLLPASHIAAYVLHRLEASPPHTISALTGLYLYHRQSWLGETNDLLAYDFGISASHVSQILMMWARVGFLRFEAFGTLPTLEEEFFMRPLNAELRSTWLPSLIGQV